MDIQFTYPLVSIIVPIYNTEQYLDKCIASICNQNYQNLEIILVDDGSTDNSYEICKKYQEQDSRIRLIHKENGGHTSARKAGLDIAAGSYVGWVDSDDWVDCDYFGRLVWGMMAEDVDMVSFLSMFLEYPNRTVATASGCLSGVYTGENLLQYLAERTISDKQCLTDVLWTSVFKKRLISEVLSLLDERILIGEDTLALYGAISRSEKVKLLKGRGYHYNRQNTDSMTHRRRAVSEKVAEIRVKWSCYQKMMTEDNWKIFEPYFWMDIKKFYLYRDISFFDEVFGGEGTCLWPFGGSVECTEKIALYGAGHLGKVIYNNLTQRNISIAAWVDADWRRYRVAGLPVESRETLQTREFDRVVVAVVDKKKAVQITEYLEGQSVPKEKILCLRDDFLGSVEFMKKCLQQDA